MILKVKNDKYIDKQKIMRERELIQACKRNDVKKVQVRKKKDKKFI